MKKIALLVALAIILTYNATAQVNFLQYHPVTSESDPEPTPTYSYPNYNSPNRVTNDNFQVVTGYFINQRGAFEKIRIKVNVQQDNYGFTSVWVRGYYDDRWHEMNKKASEVDILDNSVIKENFDYKCYVGYIGMVYF